MALASDHKALLFIGIVAVLGTGVRVVRAARTEKPATQPALEHQLAVADSAASAARRPVVKGRGFGRARAATDTGPKRSRDSISRSRRPKAAAGDSGVNAQPVGALDRPGWVNGRLDLD